MDTLWIRGFDGYLFLFDVFWNDSQIGKEYNKSTETRDELFEVLSDCFSKLSLSIAQIRRFEFHGDKGVVEVKSYTLTKEELFSYITKLEEGKNVQ